MTDDKPHIHIDKTEVRKDLIGFDKDGNCGRCHGQLDAGFGFAGGGFGPYYYCPACGEVVSKTEVPDE